MALISLTMLTVAMRSSQQCFCTQQYATGNEKDVLLGIIAKVQSWDVKLNKEMLSQLQGKKLDTFSRMTWFLRRQRVRGITANISAQKDTLIALQASMLARQMVDLNRRQLSERTYYGLLLTRPGKSSSTNPTRTSEGTSNRDARLTGSPKK
ncbi:hypothetical protein BU25DRAFT_421341 [Macroventuria anomochaeta]|uniref:Uncharacterized protein n=1 Tax=Macroventuria anomochaeta TaxID=301207 RepID=A0ACB6S0Y0_9PLEO|nr:uncharacterized protein BU25DRAFT_421341 [Macroventuria anomochaeta]KAF2627806.1 hypothetical protein BU25DRAFT_421341 [Macroventuria anomochaeta]